MDESLKIRVLVLTKEIELDVKNTTTIMELKQMIQGRANIMFIKKAIVFNDVELKDEDTIGGVNCTGGALISVVNKP